MCFSPAARREGGSVPGIGPVRQKFRDKLEGGKGTKTLLLMYEILKGSFFFVALMERELTTCCVVQVLTGG